MQEEHHNEIEMQAYSTSYSWARYASEYNPESQFEVSRPWGIFDEPREDYINYDYLNDEKLENVFEPMMYNDSFIAGTVVSGNTQSTDIIGKEEVPIIYKKLDFILESMRRQKRPPKESSSKKLIRKRKTNKQLQALQKELSGIETLSKEKMNEVAEKTGLRPGQVYKWYWDYKKKQTDSNS